jgi:hypothetical protein
MDKFSAGNIIKDPYGNLLIFVRYYTNKQPKQMFEWVCFDHSGASGSSPVKDEEVIQSCDCVEYYEDEEVYDPSCERCKGTGQYTQKRLGEKHYKLVADNAKSYLHGLLQGALKNL